MDIQPDGIYVDGTLGGGGHASHVLERLSERGRLIGIDQDEDAIAASTERLAQYGARVTIVRSNYEHMDQVLAALGIGKVNGILLDLGVSSYQLDNPERGFTYRTDAPLDMRMDQRNAVTAAQIVNSYPVDALTRILRDYGEEKCAVRIAQAIVRQRETEPITTTGQLSRIVHDSIPHRMRDKGGNPDKRTFQALRIACNRELDVLQDSLDMMIDLLEPGGRLCVITFHSLEDRIVKNAFRRNENPCTCPPEFPVCVCGKVSKGRVIGRKGFKPGAKEVSDNRRAASARLRVFERASDN